jgi:hypothetical protein
MGYSQMVRGEVAGVARGINAPNAQPDAAGLATVNPIFTWVRLAQRVPVRIRIDVAIRDIIGDLEEISSKRIVDELAQVEDGPWAEWGKGRHKKKSSPSTSVPSTPGGKVTSGRSSSICSRPTSTLCHLTPNRAARAEGDRGDHA